MFDGRIWISDFRQYRVFILGWIIEMRNHLINFIDIRKSKLKCLFFILLLFPSRVFSQPLTPDQNVLEFYKWYVMATDRQTEENYNAIDGKEIKNYISHSLLRKIKRALHNGTYDRLAEDADYFLHTQDSDVKDIPFIHSKLIKEYGRNALVLIEMGSANKNNNVVSLCVRLKREKEEWKIYQVDSFAIRDPLPKCRSSPP